MAFAERFAADGWLRISPLLEPAFVDDLRAELDGQFDELTGDDGSDYSEVGDDRLMLSIRLNGPFLEPRLFANPLLLMILHQLLGRDLVIDSLTCVVALPGAPQQHLHRDHDPLFAAASDLSWQLDAHAVQVAIPLVDLTPETGTTRLYTGTHRDAPPGDFELPYARRGDCYMTDYRLKHQGTQNRSTVRRPVLYLVYARAWFTDLHNFTRQPRINIDRPSLESIPPEYRKLFRRAVAKGVIDARECEVFPDR